jgi:hypothetical protein
MKRSVTIRRPVERTLEAARPPMQAGLHIDPGGYVCMDGVKVARLVQRDGRPCLRFPDRCKRRSSHRGTPFVDVPIAEIAQLAEKPNGSTMPGGEVADGGQD